MCSESALIEVFHRLIRRKMKLDLQKLADVEQFLAILKPYVSKAYWPDHGQAFSFSLIGWQV